MNKLTGNLTFITGSIIILCSGFFLLDLVIPLGYSGGVPYIFPVLLSSFYAAQRSVLITASICIALIILGLFLSTPSAEIWLVILNRTLAIIVILICVWFIKSRSDDAHKLSLSDQIISNMAEGVSLTRMDDGVILYTNPRFDKLFGYQTGELISKPVTVLNAPSQLDPQNEIIQSAKDNGEWNGDVHNIKKDGTEFWSRAHVSIFKHIEYGEVLLGVLTDITLHKLAEEARVQSEEGFKTLWETAADCMMTVNSDGAITLVNKKAEEVFGYDRKELIGRPVEVLVPERLRLSHAHVRLNYQAKPYRREMGSGLELRGVKKDGTHFPVLVSLTPIMINNNREILVDIQDISKRKIVEEKLQQSQKLTAIGQLTGGISHDLNNILTAMMGFTELSQQRLNNEHESFNDLNQVLKSGERAKVLISKMLAFSSQQILEPQLLTINTEIHEIENMLRELIGDSIELEITLDPDLYMSYLDRSQLGQIIVNLVVNAVDAMPGGGKILINTNNIVLDKESLVDHIVDNPGQYVELTISDNGMGMSSKILSRVFEPFYTTKKDGKGSGLGLATVYGIVKQSKGEVVIYSEPEIGTTFKIYFPVADSRVVTSQKAQEEFLPTLGSGNLILVEDEKDVRNLTKRILESSGYIVYDFESAEDALEFIPKFRNLDLVITDIILPGMSGTEFGAELKAQYPELTILYMSGFAGEAVKYINEMEDDTLFISKPFTKKTLLQKVGMQMQ